MSRYIVWLSGTSCRSCEIKIESEWKKIPGVTNAQVNAATGKAIIVVENASLELADLQQALVSTRYTVHETRPPATPHPDRLRWDHLIGLFGVVLLAAFMVSTLGLLPTTFTIGNGLSFGTAFLIGLLAASTSCIAVVGGLLLSVTATYNQRYGSTTPAGRMGPVVYFVIGRIVGYAVLGGLLGVVGSVLTPSPTITALFILLAALYMITTGLDMLHVAPRFLKDVLPRMPRAWSHGIVASGKVENPIMPFLLGAATFFLPCGFTQALQLYALTTHSFATAATVLGAFALGTAPALTVLGFAGSSVKGRVGLWFFRVAGALVVVLGLWNIQNGLTLLGHPIPFYTHTNSTNTAGVQIENNVQVVRMKATEAGYTPNHFTVKAGMPVRWEVDGSGAGGCAAVLVSERLGIQKLLTQAPNIFTFTPQNPGEIAFSCSMGMFRGSFTVVQ